MKIENIFFFETTNVKLQFHKKGPNFFFLKLFLIYFFFSCLEIIFFCNITDENGGLVFSILKKKITLG